jgi:hypothetical protein
LGFSAVLIALFELAYIIALLTISHHYMKAKQFLQVIKCLFGKLQNIYIAIVSRFSWLVLGYELVFVFKFGYPGSAKIESHPRKRTPLTI